MGFPKGASIPFGQVRGQYPAREVASFIGGVAEAIPYGDLAVSFFRKRLGQEGEEIAEGFLKKKGYKLVERNYRCKTGEVDLIVLDRKVIVFVEVKTRTDLSFGSPFEAVEARKQRKMIQAAQFFLHQHKLHQRDARFDVVGVSWPGGKPVIEHIENAFDVS